MIEFQSIVDRQSPLIAAAFLAMIAAMQREIGEAELEVLIEEGRLGEALDMVLRSAPNIATADGSAFLAAALFASVQLAEEMGASVIDFDIPGASEVMRARAQDAIRSFTEKQVLATQTAIVDGLRSGATSRRQTRAFLDSLGLTSGQVRAAAAYEAALRANSRDALSNTLRDKSGDAAVRAAIKAGAPIPESHIVSLVARYRKALLAHRAVVIGRTQALDAVQSGAEAMLDQLVRTTDLTGDEIERTWFTHQDERVRGSHRTMHGQIRILGEAFISGAGSMLMRPGDSRAPANERINCRCGLRITIRIRSSST